MKWNQRIKSIRFISWVFLPQSLILDLWYQIIQCCRIIKYATVIILNFLYAKKIKFILLIRWRWEWFRSEWSLLDTWISVSSSWTGPLTLHLMLSWTVHCLRPMLIVSNGPSEVSIRPKKHPGVVIFLFFTKITSDLDVEQFYLPLD